MQYRYANPVAAALSWLSRDTHNYRAQLALTPTGAEPYRAPLSGV